ncbi:MAG: VCBS repeat-containing protein [Flavobacteriales bacterium]|nr:VCBS repeat-containing protein [Flavobacteriales bacterium]MCB9193946.1 VCBS repeat-containing protein [Flavobacteriales bacterium]
MNHRLPTLLLLTGALSAHAQDDCSSAYPVTAGFYTITAVNGPGVPYPICAPNGSGATAGEWFSYTPTADHSLTVSTDLPMNTGLDTRFHVYNGTCGALNCVSGDDDSGSGLLSIATFNVDMGVTYFIAFDNRWSSAGFTFQLSEGNPIVNAVNFTPTSIPATGTVSCVVDMNGDHLDDVVGVTSTNININFQQQGGGFSTMNFPTAQATNTPSWSIAAGDIDNNGYNDLLYAGVGGVTFMRANADGSAYLTENRTDYIFCQRSNFVDINNDGHLDAFVCHDVAPNCYYLNDGSNALTFHQGGFGTTGGNYGSIWIDYDNDHQIDMFIAKCGGDPVNQLYHNNGDGTYTLVSPNMNMADNVQTWSSAWGDFDNDGDMDVLVGASSLGNGGHKLMRNDGTTFTNVSPGSGFDLFNGTSIEWITRDFNNDGYLDVLGGGKLMINNGDMTFTMSNITPTNGPTGDLNNDGFVDILNGSTAYMNTPNGNHYLTVDLEGTVSNRNGIGARVMVSSPLGNQIRDIRSGDGFRYMSSLNAHFGLGEDGTADVTVYWPSGIVNTVTNVAADEVITVVENTSTDVATHTPARELHLFPVPATDLVYITGPTDLTGRPVRVLDLTGREVMRADLKGDGLSVGGLASGTYMVQVVYPNGRTLQKRFIKN